MGYYTNYSLKYEPFNPDTEARFKKVYLAQTEYGIRSAVDENGYTRDSLKWYEWPNDMKRVSELLPDLLFTLHGEGEETGDMWNAYFLGGKVHYAPAEVFFPPFDPNELQDKLY